ncbi:MAG: thiamine ABC transporter substrate-binding protein [Chloroflexi bacterium]|nr:thiamine ABC transporter substrate-binding protein [Chloroflexota bacterium]
MLRNMVGWLLALLILAACGNTGTNTAQPGATTEATSAATSATDTAAGDAAEVQTVTSENYPNTLTIMSHDSFNLSTEVIAEFEKANNVKLQFLKAGDTGSALNRALLTKANPLADVFFSVDNTFLSRALSADAFEPYAPQGLDQIPTDLKLDDQNRLIPIDYGFVNLNYDLSSELFKDIPEPEQLRLEDLTKPEFKGKVVMENPATSSPGLAFMLATIDYFGQENWLSWWQQMRENDLVVVDGWETAYYTNFSGSSGKGPQPIVVSYATSPAAEVAFSEGALKEPPTGNILPPKAAFRQIEFAGILKGTKNRALAEKWMDYMISERVQNDIMPQMVIYPALPTATIPEVYQKFAPVPESPAVLDPETIATNRDAWIREWTQTVLR